MRREGLDGRKGQHSCKLVAQRFSRSISSLLLCFCEHLCVRVETWVGNIEVWVKARYGTGVSGHSYRHVEVLFVVFSFFPVVSLLLYLRYSMVS